MSINKKLTDIESVLQVEGEARVSVCHETWVVVTYDDTWDKPKNCQQNVDTQIGAATDFKEDTHGG